MNLKKKKGTTIKLNLTALCLVKNTYVYHAIQTQYSFERLSWMSLYKSLKKLGLRVKCWDGNTDLAFSLPTIRFSLTLISSFKLEVADAMLEILII